MATWTDLSGAFGFGTKLTSANMQQLRDNITALAQGASGHPEIVPAALKIGTQSDDFTGSTAWQELTLTGGQYCFLPQAYVSDAGGGVHLDLGYADLNHTSYIAYAAYRLQASAYTAYFRSRYLTASGPLWWIFALLDKKLEKVTRWNVAPDHPCYGYGNPKLVPHPFVKYDKERYQLIVATLNEEQIKDIEVLAAKKLKDVNHFIMDCCSFDFSRKAKWPDDLVTVGIETPRMKIPKLKEALILNIEF